MSRPATLELPPLYPILDVEVARRHGWDPAALGEAYLAGGATLLQIRAKTLGGQALLDLCDALVERGHRVGARVIVNDRPDIALLAEAAGVHLGQDDLPADAVRRLLGPEAVIGLSTHDTDQVARGARLPVDYLAVGPVFSTSTKDTGHTAVGLAGVRAAAGVVPGRPLVAIGGVTVARAPAILAAGATSVAVITDLLAGDDPAARVRTFLEILRNTRP